MYYVFVKRLNGRETSQKMSFNKIARLKSSSVRLHWKTFQYPKLDKFDQFSTQKEAIQVQPFLRAMITFLLKVEKHLRGSPGNVESQNNSFDGQQTESS